MTSVPETTPPVQPATKGLWVGIGIIVFGLLLTLDTLGFLHHGFFVKLWPLILVFLGLSRLGPRQEDRGISPYLFIAAGAFLLIWEFGGADFSEVMGPILIVALGILIVTRSLRRKRGVPPVLASQEGFLSTTAIFSGAS